MDVPKKALNAGIKLCTVIYNCTKPTYNSKLHIQSTTPNVVVEWFVFLLIREVPGSNLYPETGYPD
jgi:hypothetical protein